MSRNKNLDEVLSKYGLNPEQLNLKDYESSKGKNISISGYKDADIPPISLETDNIDTFKSWLELDQYAHTPEYDAVSDLPLFGHVNESVELSKLKKSAMAYLTGDTDLSVDEKTLINRYLGPFNYAVFAAGNITVGPGSNVTIQSSGALDVGTLTINQGGSLIVMASAQITVQNCIKNGAPTAGVYDIQIIGTDASTTAPDKGSTGQAGSPGQPGSNGSCNGCGTACTSGGDGTAGGTGGQGLSSTGGSSGGPCPSSVSFNITSLQGDVTVMSRGGNGQPGGAGGAGGAGGDGGAGGSEASCASCSCNGGKQGLGGSGGPGYQGSNGGDGGAGGNVQFTYTLSASSGSVQKFEFSGSGGSEGQGGTGGSPGSGGGGSPGSNGSPGSAGNDGTPSTINLIKN